jgi:hypothetical protein
MFSAKDKRFAQMKRNKMFTIFQEKQFKEMKGVEQKEIKNCLYFFVYLQKVSKFFLSHQQKNNRFFMKINSFFFPISYRFCFDEFIWGSYFSSNTKFC